MNPSVLNASAPATGQPGCGPRPRGLKYTATKIDIVNDFYDLAQRLREKYAPHAEALCAIEEVENIAIWWSNAPAVISENRGPPAPQTERVGERTTSNTDAAQGILAEDDGA